MSQIGVYVKKSNEIVSQYKANMAHSSAQLKKTSGRSKFGDINLLRASGACASGGRIVHSRNK